MKKCIYSSYSIPVYVIMYRCIINNDNEFQLWKRTTLWNILHYEHALCNSTITKLSINQSFMTKITFLVKPDLMKYNKYRNINLRIKRTLSNIIKLQSPIPCEISEGFILTGRVGAMASFDGVKHGALVLEHVLVIRSIHTALHYDFHTIVTPSRLNR